MDDDHEEMLAVCSILISCALKKKKKSRTKRTGTVWVKPWLQQREQRGLYSNLVKELQMADRGDYRRFVRMNIETFEVCLCTQYSSDS